MSFMDSNDQIPYTLGGLNDEEGQPVPGAHATGWAVTLPDGSDASAVAELVVASDGQGATVKGKDVAGSVIVTAHTANGGGIAGGDQTDQLDIGEPNVASGSLSAGTPVART